MSSIRAEGIVKNYGNVEALRGVDLDVPRGEIFGIIGPDGAGKTTLFRILTTLLVPDRGSARIEGLDVVKDYREIRRRVGYMPGRFSLYQDLTVEENINFFASLFGTTVEENYYLVKDIYSQIEPFKKRRASALSGGMKQKLALSCAMIHKPQVLFLDEPTTGVDPVSRRELWDMLQKFKKLGITILVSTPYMDEANLCDRIALIREGKFMKIGSPAEIISAFTETLWAARSNEMPRLLKDLRANPAVKSCYAFGDVHHITVNKDLTEAELKNYLISKGHKEVEIHSITPNIEDCYMYLSGY